MIIEIPSDIKDNNTHTVRIQWRSVRDARPDEIETGKRYLNTFGYTLHEWDDVDKHGTRVTLTRFMNREGRTVDLYATYYFTRVACATHDAHYAVHFASVTDEDGCTTIAAPYCDWCVTSLRRSARDTGMTLNLSETMRIGQH